MIVLAQMQHKLNYFHLETKDHGWHKYYKAIKATNNHDLLYLYENGFGMHNAGMSRKERTLMEKAFSEK